MKAATRDEEESDDLYMTSCLWMIRRQWILKIAGKIFQCSLKVFYNAKKITRSDKSHETQYKIINKLHITHEICSKYDDSCSAACKKCQKQLGLT